MVKLEDKHMTAAPIIILTITVLFLLIVSIISAVYDIKYDSAIAKTTMLLCILLLCIVVGVGIMLYQGSILVG